MKKFKFSLEKVLEYRGHIQKREKDILARLRAEYSALLAEERMLVRKYEDAKQEYTSLSAAGMKIIDAKIILCHIDNIKKLIEAQRVKINEKFLQIENQSKKLIAVTQDKMTVEKLRDKKYEDYKAELSRSEEKFIDDFLSNRSSLII